MKYRVPNVAMVVVGAVFTLALLDFLAPLLQMFSTKPSVEARKHWEKEYSSLLPPGYGDFQAHWQSHDTGVRIFSFRCPENMTGDSVLHYLSDRLPGFNAADEGPNEIAVRRPATYSGLAGFDEFRFVYVPRSRRVFGLFANLDSEMEVHGELVKKLEREAGLSR